MENRIFRVEPAEWYPFTTANKLYYDNHSRIAKQRRALWQQAKNEGDLTLYITCSDARIYPGPPEFTTQISSIAAADIGPYGRMAGDLSISNILTVSHYDGSQTTPSSIPEGCGGLGLRTEQDITGFVSLTPVSRYAQQVISAHDPVLQATYSAKRLAEYTVKPVYAAVQDHISGKMDIVYANRNGAQQFAFDKSFLTSSSPSGIYRNGIPGLNPGELSPDLQEYLTAYAASVSRLHNIYPNLKQTQRKQNPALLILSTDRRPVQVKLPDLTDRPGSAFRIHTPRYRKSDTANHAIISIIQQSSYPLTHFTGMNTIYLETHSMDRSYTILSELRQQRFFNQWLNTTGRSVILGEVHGGEIKELEQEYFDGNWRRRGMQSR